MTYMLLLNCALKLVEEIIQLYSVRYFLSLLNGLSFYLSNFLSSRCPNSLPS